MGPKGTRTITVSATPSEYRAMMNAKADMKRAAREVGALT
jgi:hypothetical protein